MIKIENVETYGWEAAIRGMRNPMNSWDKSDSNFPIEFDLDFVGDPIFSSARKVCNIGLNDLELMRKLGAAGNDHGKFLRMIGVSMDITAPLYWWKEYDTYKVGTVANSCSTMHKIHAKEFTLDDFSHEHLDEYEESLQILIDTIKALNEIREIYVNGYTAKYYIIPKGEKNYWWQMIQLLPTSYNQRRTATLNYAVLKNMYHSRKEHKLDEWRSFCEWIKTLPCANELIIN